MASQEEEQKHADHYDFSTYFYLSESCNDTRPNVCLQMDNYTQSLLYRLWSDRRAETINGYAAPTVVTVTVITNAFVCIVLLQRRFRTPTNLLLVAMAISDTLTGVFPLPSYIYFYTFANYRDYVPYRWCYVNVTLSLNLPTVCHTASIWLTVALAVQRYLSVCHPDKVKAVFTVRSTFALTAGIYAAASLSQLTRFVEHQYYPVDVESRLVRGVVVTGCIRQAELNPLGRNQLVYFAVYWWLRVVFVHLVPCASLVVLNSLLYRAMRLAERRRRALLNQDRRVESRRIAELNLATTMLLVVVGVFLLVELPLAVLLIAINVENTYDVQLMAEDDKQAAAVVVNFAILLSYPVNFFVYCGMSRQFRSSFNALFCWCPAKRNIPRRAEAEGAIDGRRAFAMVRYVKH